ncbi:MAG: methyltransferase domain-containing protein [Acidimicrobiales bacterium]
MNVLEHVDDDVDLLTQIAERLRPGGTIAIFVPAHEWLYSDFDRRIGHLRRYRLTSLAEVMDRSGLQIKVLKYVNSPGALVWLTGVRLFGLSPTPLLVRIYQRFVLSLVARFEERREPAFGQSLLALGRVPPDPIVTGR